MGKDFSRAPLVPEVERSDDHVESLVDVDSMHVNIVPSDFESQSIKTDTQADRLEREAEDEEREMEAEYKEMKREASAKTHKAKAKAHDTAAQAEAETKRTVDRMSREAKKTVDQVSGEVQKTADKVSHEAKAAKRDLRENADNPVVVGNTVVVAALSAALGFGGYRKYAAGELTWKLVGAWAGVVGVFAGGDFYHSQSVSPSHSPTLSETGYDRLLTG